MSFHSSPTWSLRLPKKPSHSDKSTTPSSFVSKSLNICWACAASPFNQLRHSSLDTFPLLSVSIWIKRDQGKEERRIEKKTERRKEEKKKKKGGMEDDLKGIWRRTILTGHGMEEPNKPVQNLFNIDQTRRIAENRLKNECTFWKSAVREVFSSSDKAMVGGVCEAIQVREKYCVVQWVRFSK